MANKKVTDLTELTTPADGDYLHIVDVSDTTDDPTGTSKKILKSSLITEEAGLIANVVDYGAVGDGTTDDTQAFQDALDDALVVFVPAGTYLIEGTITMPIGGKIYGTSRNGTGTMWSFGTVTGGSIIHLTSTTDIPFLYRSGNHFEGLTFYYPEQLPSAASPTVYPATFSPNTGVEDVITNLTWHKCQFINSYIWIDARIGHLDFEYKELTGCAVYRGIRSDGCGGTDIYNSIRMSYYYWCQFTDAIQTYMQANSTGIEIGRSDAFHMDRIYLGSMNIGLRFYIGTINTLTGPYGSITGLSCDGNNYSIYSEGTHPIGVNITEFLINSLSLSIEIAAGTSASTVLYMTGGLMWGSPDYHIRQNYASKVSITNASFDAHEISAFRVGVTGCELCLSNCRVLGALAPIIADQTLDRLFLTGNDFPQAPSLQATPGTIYRARGNSYLADASNGA